MDALSGLDAKTLLIGDIGENGSWWTGKTESNRPDKHIKRKRVGEAPRKPVNSKSPNINWSELQAWYGLIHTAGIDWQKSIKSLQTDGKAAPILPSNGDVQDIEDDLEDAREHAIRTLLKTTENLLKRPSRPIKEPDDLRFLLIILANPSLYPSRPSHPPRTPSDRQHHTASDDHHASPKKSESSQHNGLLKRIFGLIACSSENCHRYLVGWFARLDEDHFVKLVDLVASFVTHRIARKPGRQRGKNAVNDGGLIPDLSGSAMNTSAQLHSAMGLSGSVKKGPDDPNEPDWSNDWQIKAAAKVMSLLFAANNIWQGTPRNMESSTTRTKVRRSGQLLHTSSFYNTLLDYQDLIADFKVWETRREKFAFCQYPLFLSMGAKIKILEYDARRQMEIKAREAYFDQVIRQRAIDGHFTLRVRRECMVDDSLRQISAAVGAGQEELKKGLRVQFTGEEGVDAGGPRKEWFLMLVRDIFDPNHGMFIYDEDSHTCYFNPNSFETSDQYYLVGALLGLAIYNSTILDVALPSFAFRKLLAAAPSSSSNISTLTGTKNQMTYTISDLAEFRPALAAGLQQLLDFEGDVETTYCRDFVAPIDRYGTLTYHPLIPNGDSVPVTNANRHAFVDAYVRYLLDTAVARQFEPFKRGFFTVCAGNALSLFRAEEIELLIRGSDEALDVDSLRAVAVYENWRQDNPSHHPLIPRPAENVNVIIWFWEVFKNASPEKQRKLLTFITGTDRIPAVGATSLVLRIMAGGDGWSGASEEGKKERERFPVARTCFNMLVLWRYETREALEGKLWRAVEESEGFGLK
jgi:E3 ubiquitin-protein ligase HECTD2